MTDASAQSLVTGSRVVLLRKVRQWGNERWFPANETAEIFVRMVNKKTWPDEMTPHVERLGYTIRFVP